MLCSVTPELGIFKHYKLIEGFSVFPLSIDYPMSYMCYEIDLSVQMNL